MLIYMTPLMTIGLAYIVDRDDASPVWNSHARWSLWTLVALICASGAY